MASSFKVGSLMGIPVRVHITFLLILPVFAAIFAVNPMLFGDVEPGWLGFALGGVLAVVFFFCVLLHELGHSYVALKNGFQIRSITLIIFGGVAQMEDVPRDPRIEMVMAFAGPAVSLTIGISLLASTYVLGYGDLLLSPEGPAPVYAKAASWLGLINIVLAVFNLLPAFPMDGGRVLRSFLAGRTSYLNATSKAAGIGKGFAMLMGLFGLMSFLGGSAGGIWLILISFFIYIGASQEEQGTRVSFTLEGVNVGDIMTREVVTVSPEDSLDDVVRLMLNRKHTGYPVAEDGRLVGIVTLEDVHRVPRERRDDFTVEDAMSRDLITTAAETPAFDALKLLSSSDVGRLPVVDEAGELVGIISRTDLTRSLEILSG